MKMSDIEFLLERYYVVLCVGQFQQDVAVDLQSCVFMSMFERNNRCSVAGRQSHKQTFCETIKKAGENMAVRTAELRVLAMSQMDSSLTTLCYRERITLLRTVPTAFQHSWLLPYIILRQNLSVDHVREVLLCTRATVLCTRISYMRVGDCDEWRNSRRNGQLYIQLAFGCKVIHFTLTPCRHPLPTSVHYSCLPALVTITTA